MLMTFNASSHLIFIEIITIIISILLLFQYIKGNRTLMSLSGINWIQVQVCLTLNLRTQPLNHAYWHSYNSDENRVFAWIILIIPSFLHVSHCVCGISPAGRITEHFKIKSRKKISQAIIRMPTLFDHKSVRCKANHTSFYWFTLNIFYRIYSKFGG